MLAASLAAILAPAAAGAFSPGHVSGRLSADSWWSGTVYLDGDLVIPHGMTLTLTPGTRVVVASAADGTADGTDPHRVEIVVEGTLIAQGTPSDSVSFVASAPPPAPADWNGHLAAVSFTADDGFNTDPAWADTMAAYGLRMTAFIVPRWIGGPGMMTLADLRALRAAGHEIAAHTLAHPELDFLSGDSLAAELRAGRDSLEAMVADPDFRARTLAYPFGRYDQAVLDMTRDLGYAAARAVDHHGPYSPGPCTLAGVDLYRVPVEAAIGELIGADEATTRATVRAAIADWKSRGAWAVILAHAERWSDPAAFSWVVSELAADPDLWMAPFGDVAEFVRTGFREDSSGVWRPVGGGDWSWLGIRVAAGDGGDGEANFDYCSIEDAFEPLAVEAGQATFTRSVVRHPGVGVIATGTGRLTLASASVPGGSGAAVRANSYVAATGGTLGAAEGAGVLVVGPGAATLSAVTVSGTRAGLRVFREGTLSAQGSAVTGNGRGVEAGARDSVAIGGSLAGADILWPNRTLAMSVEPGGAAAAAFTSWGSVDCAVIASRVEGNIQVLPFTRDDRHSLYLDCALDSLLRVPEDYATIGGALAAASPRDSISVAAGDYSESSGESWPLLLHGEMRLAARGAPGTARVIRNTPGSAPVLEVDGADSLAEVRGFDFTGAAGTALRATGGSRLAIRANAFDGFDEAVRLEGASPLLEGNTFRGARTAAVSCRVSLPDSARSRPVIGALPAERNWFLAGNAHTVANSQPDVTIGATYNYWGSTACADFVPEFSGSVSYLPFVDSTAVCDYFDCQSGCTTGIAGGSGKPASQPARAGLIASPNPSSGTMTLLYRTPSATGPARLRIVDLTGRAVRDFGGVPGAPGESLFLWDGRDGEGRAVAAGIYFALVEEAGRPGPPIVSTKVMRLR